MGKNREELYDDNIIIEKTNINRESPEINEKDDLKLNQFTYTNQRNFIRAIMSLLYGDFVKKLDKDVAEAEYKFNKDREKVQKEINKKRKEFEKNSKAYGKNLKKTLAEKLEREINELYIKPLKEDKAINDAKVVDLSLRAKHVDIKTVKEAMLTFLNENDVHERFANNFLNKDVFLSDYKNSINAIKEMINNGKMSYNIQTVDNEFDKSTDEFYLSPLEKQIVKDLASLSKNAKKEINDYIPSDKTIVSKVTNSMTSADISTYLNNKKNEYFPTKAIYFDKDVSLNEKIEDAKNKNPKIVTSNNDEIITKIDSKYLFSGKITPENLKSFANDVKKINDMLNNKPWYVRWFYKDHKNSVKLLNEAKKALTNRGLDEKDLNRFLKASDDKKDQILDEIVDKAKNRIDTINKNSLKRQEKLTPKIDKEKDYAKFKEDLDLEIKNEKFLNEKIVDENINKEQENEKDLDLDYLDVKDELQEVHDDVNFDLELQDNLSSDLEEFEPVLNDVDKLIEDNKKMENSNEIIEEDINIIENS